MIFFMFLSKVSFIKNENKYNKKLVRFIRSFCRIRDPWNNTLYDWNLIMVFSVLLAYNHWNYGIFFSFVQFALDDIWRQFTAFYTLTFLLICKNQVLVLEAIFYKFGISWRLDAVLYIFNYMCFLKLIFLFSNTFF